MYMPIMLLTTDGFSTLLQVLGLAPVLFKPGPRFPTSSTGDTMSHFNVPTSAVLPEPPAIGAANDFQAQTSSQRFSLLDTYDTAQNLNQQHGSLCNADPYTCLPVDQTFPPFDQAKASVYRYRQQQSVNLGSWFVHERWMTPSLFKCASGDQISELDIASGWGSTRAARAVLERHWDTFINQSDFEYLASIGINTVRLPIGYWSLGSYFCQDTPFSAVADVYQNSWSRVVRAINMAGEAGIGVLVDLHGAVGSQNGQPHSGISDHKTNLFTVPSNIDKTIAVLKFLMQQLENVTNVVGIQILNEPQNVAELSDFYTRAISSMRQISTGAATFPCYLHDGFDIERFSRYIANRTDFVVQDTHSYFVFTPSDEAEPASQHTNDVETTVSDSLANASTRQHRNLVVGEWSCALTPNSMSNEADQNKARKDFGTGQMEVYTNTTAGWSFWSYKMEECDNDPGWCFKAAVGSSLPSTFFSYSGRPIANAVQLQSINADMNLPSIKDILANAQHQDNPMSPLLSRQRRSRPSPTAPTPPPSESKTKVSNYHHRRASVHIRQQAKRDKNDSDMTADQQAIAKGYSDGFLTTKTFAMFGGSKLGFVGQYIEDRLTTLVPTVITEETGEIYREWFLRGILDGQAAVVSLTNP